MYGFIVVKENLFYSCNLTRRMVLAYYMQESSEFHKRSFESNVDTIRAIAASHLWQVNDEEVLIFLFWENIYTIMRMYNVLLYL